MKQNMRKGYFYHIGMGWEILLQGLSTDVGKDETHTSQTGLTVTSGRDQGESGNFMNYVMAMAVCKEFFVLAFWWGMWVEWTARLGNYRS